MTLRTVLELMRRKAMENPWAVAISCAGLFAFLLKVRIALGTYGTNDVLYWETFLATAKRAGGAGLYHEVWYFNHPPFMISVLYVLDLMARVTGIAFSFWLKLPAIAADLGTLFLLWNLLRRESRFEPIALVLTALAPTSIMVSGFHGNTDSLMIGFVLLSVWLLVKERPCWMAGIALGMAMNIKVVPIVFMPVVFLVLPSAQARAQYFLAVAGTFIAGSLPYLLDDPVFIVERVFGYGSLYGQWGISRLLGSSPQLAWVSSIYQQQGKLVVLVAAVIAAVWMKTLPKRPSIFHQLGFTVFLFMSLSPGFGVQYLVWLVPWVAGLGTGATLVYSVTSGLFQFLVYDFWSGGWPWFLANSDKVGPWRGHIVYFEVLCWAAVVGLTLRYRDRLKGAAA